MASSRRPRRRRQRPERPKGQGCQISNTVTSVPEHSRLSLAAYYLVHECRCLPISRGSVLLATLSQVVVRDPAVIASACGTAGGWGGVGPPADVRATDDNDGGDGLGESAVLRCRGRQDTSDERRHDGIR